MTDLDRTKLTFEQAEGLEPLPAQLKPRELTQRLRASLWYVLHQHLLGARREYNLVVGEPWNSILHANHVFRLGCLRTSSTGPSLLRQSC
jgi:hypothetical protein